jgi:hypothetical protein
MVVDSLGSFGTTNLVKSRISDTAPSGQRTTSQVPEAKLFRQNQKSHGWAFHPSTHADEVIAATAANVWCQEGIDLGQARSRFGRFLFLITFQILRSPHR